MLDTNKNFFNLIGFYLKNRDPRIFAPKDTLNLILSEMLCCEAEFVKPALELRDLCIVEDRAPTIQETKIIFANFAPFLGKLPYNYKSLLCKEIRQNIIPLQPIEAKKNRDRKKYITSVLLNKYVQKAFQNCCLCQIGLSDEDSARVMQKTIQDIIFRLPLLATSNDDPELNQQLKKSLEASIKSITKKQQLKILNSLLMLNIFDIASASNNFNIPIKQPLEIFDSIHRNKRWQLEEVFLISSDSLVSHTQAWGEFRSKLVNYNKKVRDEKLPTKTLVSFLSILLFSMFLGQVSPFVVIIYSVCAVILGATYARFSTINVRSWLKKGNYKDMEDILFQVIEMGGNEKSRLTLKELSIESPWSLPMVAVESQPTVEYKPISRPSSQNVREKLLKNRQRKILKEEQRFFFQTKEIDGSKIKPIINGHNQFFYLDHRSLQAEIFKKKPEQALAIMRNFHNTQTQFCGTESENGLSKLTKPLEGKVIIDNKIFLVNFTHELKPLNLGAQRIMLCELKFDDKKTLYLGCKYLPHGLHKKNNIFSAVKSLETPIVINLPYKKVIQPRNEITISRQSDYRKPTL